MLLLIFLFFIFRDQLLLVEVKELVIILIIDATLVCRAHFNHCVDGRLLLLVILVG